MSARYSRFSKKGRKRSCTDEKGQADETKKRIKVMTTEAESSGEKQKQLDCSSHEDRTEVSQKATAVPTSIKVTNETPSTESNTVGTRVVPAFGKKLSSQQACNSKNSVTSIYDGKERKRNDVVHKKDGNENFLHSSKVDEDKAKLPTRDSSIQKQGKTKDAGNSFLTKEAKESLSLEDVERSTKKVSSENELELNLEIGGDVGEACGDMKSQLATSKNGQKGADKNSRGEEEEGEDNKTYMDGLKEGYKGEMNMEAGNVQEVGQGSLKDEGVELPAKTGIQKLQLVKQGETIPDSSVDRGKKDILNSDINAQDELNQQLVKVNVPNGDKAMVVEASVGESATAIGETQAFDVASTSNTIEAKSTEMTGHVEAPSKYDTDKKTSEKVNEAKQIQEVNVKSVIAPPPTERDEIVKSKKESFSTDDRDKDLDGTWGIPGCPEMMDFTSSQLQQIDDAELQLTGDTKPAPARMAAKPMTVMAVNRPTAGPSRPIMQAPRVMVGHAAVEKATAQREGEEKRENGRVKGAMQNMMKDLNDIKLMAGSLLTQMSHYRKHRSQRQPSSFLGKKSAPLSFPRQPKGSAPSQFMKF